MENKPNLPNYFTYILKLNIRFRSNRKYSFFYCDHNIKLRYVARKTHT